MLLNSALETEINFNMTTRTLWFEREICCFADTRSSVNCQFICKSKYKWLGMLSMGLPKQKGWHTPGFLACISECPWLPKRLYYNPSLFFKLCARARHREPKWAHWARMRGEAGDIHFNILCSSEEGLPASQKFSEHKGALRGLQKERWVKPVWQPSTGSLRSHSTQLETTCSPMSLYVFTRARILWVDK